MPREVERFGAVRFEGLQKVFELDSGIKKDFPLPKSSPIIQVPYQELYDIEKDMAIIVPIYNERLKLVEGVLRGIPHQCLIIIVSNSPRSPVDRYAMEQNALNDFCLFTDKNALIVHQKEPVLAEAFKKAGYVSILDEKGEVRSGKAEGMIIGKMLAKVAGKKYIGFIDADNYFPGSVTEYIHEYAAAFTQSKSPYTMVRIAWHSKPKIIGSKLFFRKWGRVSANTNKILNELIACYTGFETEIIKTGNAGEHALTMDSAMILNYSVGYSIEPYHIIDMMEKFGGTKKSSYPEVMEKGVYIYQMESCNPHLHEAKGIEHIAEMNYMAMQVIYHSFLCDEKFKKRILKEMLRKKYLKKGTIPPQPIRMQQPGSINPELFLEYIKSHLKNMVKGRRSRAV